MIVRDASPAAINARLLDAARRGEVGAVQTALELGADIHHRGVGGAGALALAAAQGALPAVDLLIRAGADVNAADTWHRTPLHEAALGGYPQVTQRLLDAGADPWLKDRDGMSPVHIAQGLERLALDRQNDEAFARTKAAEQARQAQERQPDLSR
jgi:ankyrin repeat protein